MAELRNGGMAGMVVRRKEWQNGRMAEMATYVLFTVDTHQWNGGMVEWWNGGMAEWRNSGMVIE